MAQSELKTRVIQQWAQYFACDVSDFSRPGTQVVYHKPIDESDYIDILQIEERAFVEVGARHLERVQAALAASEPSKPLNAYQVAELCGVRNPESYYNFAVTFADSDMLVMPDISEPYAVRQLTQSDEDILKRMQNACTKEETSEGDVAVNHEVAFGCVTRDQIVACASMFYWRGFADIGVLTHPEHRSKGTGKAVTAATARWVLDRGEIPVYRHDLNNLGSAGISRSLGFVRFQYHESIKII